MVTYVFPGQGSQVRGMGGSLFKEFPEYTQQAHDILGYSIETLCLENPNEQLSKTCYTQPALYVVNALSYLKKLQDTAKKPDYVAGHSLGEYNALFVAGAFDFATGLKLVQKRGELMNQAIGGGMAAVVGLKSDEITDILEKNHLIDIYPANYNSYTQVVISGPTEAIKQAEKVFIQAGATLYIPLKVSGAFHSPYMQEARNEFAQYLNRFTFKLPVIPVIANISATPYSQDIHTYLADQMIHPVLWSKSIEYLISHGETVFEEVGPGKVLSGLIARIQRGQ